MIFYRKAVFKKNPFKKAIPCKKRSLFMLLIFSTFFIELSIDLKVIFDAITNVM